jgi:hypothetical protein
MTVRAIRLIDWAMDWAPLFLPALVLLALSAGIPVR